MTTSVPHQVASGWQAKLQLGFTRKSFRTILKDISHVGPLRVQRPFYPESDLPHTYLLHPPGGVVGGDEINIQAHVGVDAQALITTPGATKFYLSAGERAEVRQVLHVAKGGSLEWFPQENILFPGARLKADTDIYLQEDAAFIGWEINCLGRPVLNETFHNGDFNSRLRLYRDRHLAIVERQRVIDEPSLTAAAGLQGMPMQALMLATPCDASHLEAARDVLATQGADLIIAATLIEDLLVIRALGHQTELIQQALIPMWQRLRPQMLGRSAITPRIWST